MITFVFQAVHANTLPYLMLYKCKSILTTTDTQVPLQLSAWTCDMRPAADLTSGALGSFNTYNEHSRVLPVFTADGEDQPGLGGTRHVAGRSGANGRRDWTVINEEYPGLMRQLMKKKSKYFI
ncbi:uncharacterized protein LOC134201215 [Bombyx mori]|uniref:uncharacterized protein LOC134201215 n=1 Tax=Bombyx mori TaxID=7091 RepID=UPI002ED317C4